jgi:hypothetical protein
MKRPWPILKYNPGIFLEGLRKTAILVREDPVSGIWDMQNEDYS